MIDKEKERKWQRKRNVDGFTEEPKSRMKKKQRIIFWIKIIINIFTAEIIKKPTKKRKLNGKKNQNNMTTSKVWTIIGTYPTNERIAVVHSRTVNYKNNHNK